MEPYTVALTSCGRFDLLERTLGSLLPRLEGPVAKLVITEDSGDPAVHDVIRRFSGGGLKFEVLVNERRLGLIRSIDRLYSRVETEWVFHCEDDWVFFSDGFIGPSFAVLKESDRHSMVGLRSASEFAPGYLGPRLATRSGIAYRVPDPAVARAFAGLTFNPGLRRMRDYRIVGPYSDFRALARESRVARCYLELGYRMAYLAEPAVRHIGDERHVRDATRPRVFPDRFVRSMRKRSDRLRFKLHPRSDPAVRARRPERRDTRCPAGLARSVILPVFVINLDRRPDRWAAVSGHLGALGIVSERIRATDADRVMGAIPDDLSFSQAACRESHFAALDAFLQTGAPAGLILEDDAELAPGVCGLLASADWWPPAARVVKLGGGDGPVLLGRPVGRTPGGGEIRPVARASAVACAYMIDREGAGIAIGEAPRVGMTVDSFLFHMVGSPAARRLKPAHVVPALARVRPGQGSDICRDLSPHATGPAMRAVFRTGLWLRRLTGQVRRVPVAWCGTRSG